MHLLARDERCAKCAHVLGFLWAYRFAFTYSLECSKQRAIGEERLRLERYDFFAFECCCP